MDSDLFLTTELDVLLHEKTVEDIIFDIAEENVVKYDNVAKLQRFWKEYFNNDNLVNLKFNPDNTVDWFTAVLSSPRYHVLRDNNSSLFQGLDYSPFINTIIDNIRGNELEESNLLDFVGLIREIIPGKITYILFETGVLYYLIENEFIQIDENVSKIITLDNYTNKTKLIVDDQLPILLYLKENNLFFFQYGKINNKQVNVIGRLKHDFIVKDMKLITITIPTLFLLDEDGNLFVMDVDYVSLKEYIALTLQGVDISPEVKQIVANGPNSAEMEEFMKRRITEIPEIEREVNISLTDRNIVDFHVVYTYNTSTDFAIHIFYINDERKLMYNYRRINKGIDIVNFEVRITNKFWRYINENILMDMDDNFYYINYNEIFNEYNGKSTNVIENAMNKFFKKFDLEQLFAPTEKEIKMVKAIKNENNMINIYILDIEGNMYSKKFGVNDKYIPFTEKYELHYEVEYEDYSGMKIGDFFITNHADENGIIILCTGEIVEVPYEHFILELYKGNILYDRIDNGMVAYIRYDRPYIYLAKVK